MSYLNGPSETAVPEDRACAWGGIMSFQLGLLEHQPLAF